MTKLSVTPGDAGHAFSAPPRSHLDQPPVVSMYPSGVGEHRKDGGVLISTDQKRTDAAKVAARARWGPRRVLRLDQLDPLERRLIEAILTATRNAERSGEAAQDAA